MTDTTARSRQAAPETYQNQRSYTHREILEILSALIMASLTSAVTMSVVGTALPTIVGELGGQDQLSWVAASTLLTSTASTPLWGKLSDRLGRKLLIQLALAIFVLSSIAAGFASGMGELIAARALQGLGSGGLMALTQVILGDVIAPRERGRYAGYMGAAFGVSTVAGPLLGGFLVDTDWLGWRWCFWVSVPLAVVAFGIIQRVLKLPRRHTTREPIDWAGAGLLTGGTTALMLLLTLGGKEFAWTSAWSWGLGIGSAAAFGLAIVAERYAADPILPPRLFGDHTFNLTTIANFMLGMSMFGALIFVPQYLQIVKGMSPTMSGLMTLPMVFGMLGSSIVSGQIVTKTGRWKVFPVIGLVLVALVMGWMSRLHVGTSQLMIGIELALLGIGLGLTMQTLILAVQNAVDRSDLAVATSSATYFRSLGGAVGVAAFGAILSNRLVTELTSLLAAAHVKAGAMAGNTKLGTPDAIHHLPGPIRDMVLEAFTRALDTVFLVGVPGAVVALGAVILLRELPLRSSAAPAAGSELDVPQEQTRQEVSADTGLVSRPS